MPKVKSTPVHGNYKGYYTKRGNLSSDPRLHVLPSGLFAGKRVLDVGCNEGWVTCEIARDHNAQEVIGVDIDAELVSQAWRHRRDIWSLQPPPSKEKDNIDGLADSDGGESLHTSLAYFPECFSSLFGHIPISNKNSSFPNNLSFLTSDWASQGCPADEAGYDVVVAFSVSKWIHIHGGDDGLKLFFSRVRDVLRKRSSGGAFILEAQPSSGYRSAIRKAGTQAKQIALDPDDFPALLAQLGFSKPTRAGVVGEGGFKRPVDVYRLES